MKFYITKWYLILKWHFILHIQIEIQFTNLPESYTYRILKIADTYHQMGIAQPSLSPDFNLEPNSPLKADLETFIDQLNTEPCGMDLMNNYFEQHTELVDILSEASPEYIGFTPSYSEPFYSTKFPGKFPDPCGKYPDCPDLLDFDLPLSALNEDLATTGVNVLEQAIEETLSAEVSFSLIQFQLSFN